jgi:hypothetical protein
MSDPETFLLVRRGILQFVFVKILYGLLTAIMKITETYREGYIAFDSAYLWLSLLYNSSVCISMYFLVMFYLQCHRDLMPYRPFGKFVCVKAIIFFTFWQGFLISILVAAGIIQGSEFYYETAQNDCDFMKFGVHIV